MTNGRKAFLQTLTKLAEKDPRVILIIGDVGFSFIEPFKERFPNQFLNVGVLEQTMMGLAVGMSRAGWKPMVYTMVNFIVFRPYEQVRNDIAYGNANVKLFGVEGSEAYKFLGHSHNVEKLEHNGNKEDIQLLGHLPNMNVYTPLNERQVDMYMLEEYNRQGPSYMRI